MKMHYVSLEELTAADLEPLTLVRRFRHSSVFARVRIFRCFLIYVVPQAQICVCEYTDRAEWLQDVAIVLTIEDVDGDDGMGGCVPLPIMPPSRPVGGQVPVPSIVADCPAM